MMVTVTINNESHINESDQHEDGFTQSNEDVFKAVSKSPETMRIVTNWSEKAHIVLASC